MSDCPRASDNRHGLAVFSLAFFAYAATAFPGLAGGDSSELTAAAFAMGIPHPTGYPLYMIVARLWLWLFPVGEAAFRLNVLSGLCAAAAAAVLFLLHRGLRRGAALSGALALLFAFSPGVWSQGIVAEVYTFQLLLGVLYLFAILRWCGGEGTSWLLAASLLAGAQLAHHLTSVSVVAAGGLIVLWRSREVPWRIMGWRMVLLAALPLALYGYLLVRSLTNPPVDQGNPETFAALLRHMTGRQYQSRLFPVRWPEVAANARFLLTAVQADLPLLLSIPALVGIVLSVLRAGPFGLGVAALALMHGVFCLLYRVADLEGFMLPLLLSLNLGLGEAATRLGAWRGLADRRVPRGIAAGLLAAGVTCFGAFNAVRMNPGPAFLASSYASDILDSLPFKAQLLAEGDFAIHSLLYAQVVEQRRTDVSVFAQDGNLFQGYGARRWGTSRLFTTSPQLGAGPSGDPPQQHGVVYVSSSSAAAPGPDPGQVYRPLPDDGELRRQGRLDAMAQASLVDRLNHRWERARETGDLPAAERIAGLILAESEAYLRMIVPREDEFRSMVKTATRLERWDLIVLWTERLAAVSTLDARSANNLAWAYHQTGGDLGRAERLARAAVAAEPDNAQFLDTLAGVLAAAGKPKEAAGSAKPPGEGAGR